MQTRRRFVSAVGATATTVGLAGCSDGADTEPADSPTPTEGPAGDGDDGGGENRGDGDGDGVDTTTGSLAFSSPVFEDGRTIPERHTGVGGDVSPPLTIESAPGGAETLALVVDDPDANNYVHWLLWNVPADVESIPEGIPQEETVSELAGARQGENDFGEIGYRGPLPPADDGAHTYRFELSAVDTTLDLPAGSGRGELESALDGHVVDAATMTGEFNRE